MTEQFAVTGMTCAACSAHVEKAVSRLSGVQSAPVNLMLGSMTVTYDEKAVTEGDIIAAVKAAGYGASPASQTDQGQLRRDQDAALRRGTWVTAKMPRKVATEAITPPSAAGRNTSSGRWYFWCRCST